MTKQIHFDEYKDEDVIGPPILARATVAPGTTSDLVVGVYENSIPEPDISLEIASQGHNMEASLERKDGRGEYTLIYHVANRGAFPLDVEVKNLEAIAV